jgi:hypothetical protein
MPQTTAEYAGSIQKTLRATNLVLYYKAPNCLDKPTQTSVKKHILIVNTRSPLLTHSTTSDISHTTSNTECRPFGTISLSNYEHTFTVNGKTRITSSFLLAFSFRGLQCNGVPNRLLYFGKHRMSCTEMTTTRTEKHIRWRLIQSRAQKPQVIRHQGVSTCIQVVAKLMWHVIWLTINAEKKTYAAVI